MVGETGCEISSSPEICGGVDWDYRVSLSPVVASGFSGRQSVSHGVSLVL